jgi:hypothetical protein
MIIAAGLAFTAMRTIASARFCSVMSREILEAPTILPSS